ncbi:MAG: prepilin-type N-terminal cleavage/methylation domain-containing protein [Thermodesulfovibrio sp.]|nr:prepilin-type N-terminal cleavage/methylation domain-containing protein [Thermodesulfovibrio sp.]
MVQTRLQSNGYTLIEVIVAVAIFTAMLAFGAMALNQTLMQYKTLAEKGFSFWDYAKVIWLDKSIASTTDYYVYTTTQGWFPYFIGNNKGFSYVSLSAFAGDSPVVAWVIKEEENEGKQSLIYYELPVITKDYEKINDDFIFEKYKNGYSYQIIRNAKSIDFQYYGYDVVKRKYEWSSDFDSKLKKNLPTAIMITYETEEGQNRLILKVNTNSLGKLYYNEIYKR